MSANPKQVVNKNSSGDSFKWALAVLLTAAAIVGNYYFRDYQYLAVRVIAVVAVMAAAAGLVLLTSKGKSFVSFAKEARVEMRKVIWPTRQEATHTTMIVAVVTILMALILWGFDGILVRAITWITNFGVGV